jgi:hypothetical protein
LGKFILDDSFPSASFPKYREYARIDLPYCWLDSLLDSFAGQLLIECEDGLCVVSSTGIVLFLQVTRKMKL